MADKSTIEWTDATWTPIRARNRATGKIGWHCEHATTGCKFCYAEGFNKWRGTGLPFKPRHRKDIEIFLDEDMLLAPLKWKKPRMIFVCSMTDAFADFVEDEWLDKMFAIMALCPQHTFQVLTKRAERMRYYCAGLTVRNSVELEAERIQPSKGLAVSPKWCFRWPLPNVWLGVSAERQQEADERVPHLLGTRAAVRFVSAEPLLGPIDLADIANDGDTFFNVLRGHAAEECQERWRNGVPKLDWIIVGGESGKNARPMHPDWPTSLRDQCAAAGVPFFFKQWGEWVPSNPIFGEFERVGKKAAGLLLDGKEHNAFPELRG